MASLDEKATPASKETYAAERLKKLALPNCHLVEAVLKEHYHIFNDDCRDRLKKLLEVILTVNGGGKKFDKLDEHFKRECIKNLKRRLKSLEEAHRKKEEMNRKRVHSISDLANPSGDHQVENVKSTDKMFETNSAEDVTDCGDHSENDRESYITAIEGLPYEEEIELAAALTIEEEKAQALKEFEDLDQLFDEYKISLTDALNGSLSMLNEKDMKRTKKRLKSPRRNALKTPKAEGDGSANGKIKKKVAFKDPLVEEEVEIIMELGDIPSLALRYYIALLADMKRNSKLYNDFIKLAIQPTEVYKKPYVNAAYDCWMEYFCYNKCTLDYLHPYIKDMMKMCRLYRPGHPKMEPYETKLPVVLINGIKNIKPWRNALEETIKCCSQLAVTGNEGGVRVGVNKLYVRHYEKIQALETRVNSTLIEE